jgi:hypothetical protein
VCIADADSDGDSERDSYGNNGTVGNAERDTMCGDSVE